MARKPMVTRTIMTTEATALCLNIETAEPFNKTVTVSGAFKKEDKELMKAVAKLIDSETEKAVTIVDAVVKETLYGMTEDDFISHSEVLPPRAKKEAEADNNFKGEN